MTEVADWDKLYTKPCSVTTSLRVYAMFVAAAVVLVEGAGGGDAEGVFVSPAMFCCAS